MIIRTVRAVAWTLAAVAAVFTLSGCDGTLKMKLVNGGGYPITGVAVYPAVAEGETPGPDAQINRMPKDAEDHTVALLPKDQTMLDGRFRSEVYQVSVTFYDGKNQVFPQVQAPNPLDLDGVKRNSVIVLTAAMDANNAGTIKFEILEDNANIFSWRGWEVILTVAGVLSLLYFFGVSDL